MFGARPPLRPHSKKSRMQKTMVWFFLAPSKVRPIGLVVTLVIELSSHNVNWHSHIRSSDESATEVATPSGHPLTIRNWCPLEVVVRS